MSRWRGETEAVLSSVCFGIAPLFAKKGLMSGLHPFHGATIANVTALVIMLFFVFLSTGWSRLRPVKRRGLFYAILSGLCNSIAVVSLFGAISIGKVALVVPVTCTYPLFTLLVAYFTLKKSEGIDRFTVTGTFLIVTGVILTI
jgi:transporter family protein